MPPKIAVLFSGALLFGTIQKADDAQRKPLQFEITWCILLFREILERKHRFQKERRGPMEQLNKCPGCMEDTKNFPCPHCGYDPSAQTRIAYALPPDTILIGRYLVGRILGQGGFGMTYIGWDISLGLKVAIKEYYPSGQVVRTPGQRTVTWFQTELSQQAQQDGMEMFLKEARKMARVDGIPGVVKVRDLFRENETAYIVMDFVEGETLKARLQKTGPMPWSKAKDIFLPAIRAMEQVHENGLIHRDLSPDNLMLTPRGKVEILDLGAAKDLNISSGASSMQVAKGGFSPLEQYTQRGGSGTWTDVYAMAATIYYTLTGILPPAAFDRMGEDTLSWSAPGLQTLPANGVEVLKKALEISAKERIQTMKEFENGLFQKEETEIQTKELAESKPEPKRKTQWFTAWMGTVLTIFGCIAACGHNSVLYTLRIGGGGVFLVINISAMMLFIATIVETCGIIAGIQSSNKMNRGISIIIGAVTLLMICFFLYT